MRKGHRFCIITLLHVCMAMSALATSTEKQTTKAEPATHLVAKGDTLSSIARRYHAKIGDLKTANGLKDDLIRIGQTLKIPSAKPAVVKAVAAEEVAKPALDSVDPAPKNLTLEERLEKLGVADRFRLQVYLDGVGFAPGKVDGLAGEFTVKAARRWLSTSSDRDLENLLAAARQAVAEPLVPFEITQEAANFVGEVPVDLAERAAAKTLPYETLAEYVAERFHTDEATLSRCNGDLKTTRFEVGTTVKVPAVSPFRIEASRTSAASKERLPGAVLRVMHQEHLLEVCDADGALAAVFPITVGAKPEYVRSGTWKISAVAPNPNFMWDEEMLKHGRKGTKQYLLPPGPNNPVGVFWLELQPVHGPEAHIGIHGTNDPTHIGRNHSSGCIRLANWDIVRLSRLVGAGTQVVWDPQPESPRVVAAE
jgi:lipoprotein-anchoring transpeptidase ErfK/SrfK/LysM repeat protein